MKMRNMWMGLASVSLLVLLTGGGTAEDKKETNKPSAAELMAKFGEPGPEHKALEPLVGTWDCAVKFWFAPGQPPQESKGTGKRHWILGKRFIEENFEGSALGTPFKGLGVTGFDRAAKKYSSFWIDSMTTSMTLIHGTYDPETKTFTYRGEEQAPFMAKKWKVRDVLKIVDDNRQVLEAYRQIGTSPEFKTLEITFTRKEK
jgi:hypothetical protein